MATAQETVLSCSVRVRVLFGDTQARRIGRGGSCDALPGGGVGVSGGVSVAVPPFNTPACSGVGASPQGDFIQKLRQRQRNEVTIECRVRNFFASRLGSHRLSVESNLGRIGRHVKF